MLKIRLEVVRVAALMLSTLFIVPQLSASRVSDARVWQEGGQSLPYRLFSPTNAQPEIAYPLVLFLHGSGERGTDNQRQIASHIAGLIDATAQPAYNSYLLAPQIPTNQGWSAFNSPALSPGMALSLQVVDDMIASGRVDADRVYITGLSLGGFGTFDAIAKAPGRFAAAVPLSGGAPVSIAPAIVDVPLWAFHGGSDTVVPVQFTQQIVNAIAIAGGSPRYSQVSGGGHNIWGPIYRDEPASVTGGGLYEWMFNQSLPEPTVLTVFACVLPFVFSRHSRVRQTHL
jgi:predicted peptidase